MRPLTFTAGLIVGAVVGFLASDLIAIGIQCPCCGSEL